MSAGAYTISNNLAAQTYPVLHGNVTVVNGILSGVNISRGGTCTSVTPYGPIDQDCESYSNDYSVANPGAVQTYEPPVPPNDACHCPPNTDWTLTYTITATGNANAFAQGSFTLTPDGVYVVTFGYHVVEINGQAFYSYTITPYVNGVAQTPTLYSIGDQPAASSTPTTA